jgi:hypothetical protein
MSMVGDRVRLASGQGIFFEGADLGTGRIFTAYRNGLAETPQLSPISTPLDMLFVLPGSE